MLVWALGDALEQVGAGRGERAGPREIGLGRWRARREREQWAGERLGRAEGSGWCFGFLGFLFYFFFFSISNQIQLIEFKLI